MKQKSVLYRPMLLLSVLLLGSCEVIEYHPYDTRTTGEKDINVKNIQRIEETTAGLTSFRFAMISDTQRSYDETEEVIASLNTRDDIRFVVHGGDLADFGETKEFTWARDRLDRLHVPYVCLLGNHDCLGTGRDVFRTVFGEANFAFTAGDVRFICLNTNALEYDYSHPIPDFGFLENEIINVPSDISRTVVVMHVPPGDDEFNNNVSKPFQLYLHQFPNLQFCLYGHVHDFRQNDIFNDGIIYYSCTSVHKRGYLLITIKENGYEVEECSF
ncbi:MAG: metallophosphoesterase [Paraprevotella sp.]|nr:metallophosphoesterase [Paraprevotella sp.]MBP3470929.1 metallophosphoesterase [Paraprevotella sp.]